MKSFFSFMLILASHGYLPATAVAESNVNDNPCMVYLSDLSPNRARHYLDEAHLNELRTLGYGYTYTDSPGLPKLIVGWNERPTLLSAAGDEIYETVYNIFHPGEVVLSQNQGSDFVARASVKLIKEQNVFGPFLGRKVVYAPFGNWSDERREASMTDAIRKLPTCSL